MTNSEEYILTQKLIMRLPNPASRHRRALIPCFHSISLSAARFQTSNVFSFAIYMIFYSILFAGFANLVFPISQPVAVVTILVASLAALASTRSIPLESWSNQHSTAEEGTPPLPKTARFLIFAFVVLFLFAASSRQTIGVDGNEYHLPLSRLLNITQWYPGIVNLNSHYGFPNGTALASSLFTVFGWAGSENVFTLIVWLLLATFLVHTLQLEKMPCWIYTSICVGIILQYDMFFQAYNMGTDLPAAFFILAGLTALKKGRWDDAALLLAMSACFKQPGQWAYFLCILVIVLTQRNLLRAPKAILSYMLLALLILRTYIGTGVPFYPLPIVIFPVPAWGVPADAILRLAGDLVHYGPKVDYSLSSSAMFWFHFFTNPKLVQSSTWFAPPFAILLVLQFYAFCKGPSYPQASVKPQINSMATIASLIILFAWFLTFPLFRFVAGIWIYLYLELNIRVWHTHVPFLRAILAIVVTGWGLVFGAHELIKATRLIAPRAFCGTPNQYVHARAVYSQMVDEPYTSTFTLKHTSKGMPYLYTDGIFQGMWPPPIVSKRRSLGGPEEVVQRFYKYNPRYRPCTNKQCLPFLDTR